MTTEINASYAEHNCIFISIWLFQHYVSPPSISMYCWILRVMLCIKWCKRFWLVLSRYDIISLIISSISLRHFGIILSMIHPKIVWIGCKSGLQLCHSNMVTFSLLNHCFWHLHYVLELFPKFMPCYLVICVSLHTAGPSLLLISCFKLSTHSLSSINKYSQAPLVSGIKNSGLSAPSLYYIPPILWRIV